MSSDSLSPQQEQIQQWSMSKLPPLIDVDCNLWHRDLKSLLPNERKSESNPNNDDVDNTVTPVWNILSEDAIEQVNIIAMISPSSTIEESFRGLELLQQYPPPLPIKTTVGVHPYHVNDKELSGKTLEEHKSTVKSLLLTSPSSSSSSSSSTTKTTRSTIAQKWIAAIGECGLDNSNGFPPLEDQLPWFQLQIEVAEELGLPLFVHERLAFDDTLRLLDHVTVPILIHCFTGTLEQCQTYVDRGYFISVSGFILKDSDDNKTNGPSWDVLSCLRQGIIPLDKLMIETDAPYMGFDNCRQHYMQHNQEYIRTNLNSKQRKRLQQSIYPNVPSSLPLVLQKVTECLQQYDPSLTVEKVAAVTTNNAQSFFGL
jgi:TatD DNase family protein